MWKRASCRAAYTAMRKASALLRIQTEVPCAAGTALVSAWLGREERTNSKLFRGARTILQAVVASVARNVSRTSAARGRQGGGIGEDGCFNTWKSALGGSNQRAQHQECLRKPSCAACAGHHGPDHQRAQNRGNRNIIGNQVCGHVNTILNQVATYVTVTLIYIVSE